MKVEVIDVIVGAECPDPLCLNDGAVVFLKRIGREDAGLLIEKASYLDIDDKLTIANFDVAATVEIKATNDVSRKVHMIVVDYQNISSGLARDQVAKATTSAELGVVIAQA